MQPAWRQVIADVSGVAQVSLEGDVFNITVTQLDEQVPAIIGALNDVGAKIRSVQDAEDSLEDVYLQMVTEDNEAVEGVKT